MLAPGSFTGKIHINIVNFTKGSSLFYYGMKPSFYSIRAQAATGKGWF